MQATAALNGLIRALDDQRIKRQLNHHDFSVFLGISESYWSMIRNGKRNLTPNLAVMFMQKLPELTPAVTTFIMRQGNDGDNQKDAAQTGGQTPALGQLCTPTGRKGRKT